MMSLNNFFCWTGVAEVTQEAGSQTEKVKKRVREDLNYQIFRCLNIKTYFFFFKDRHGLMIINVVVSFNKKVDVRTFRKVTVTTIEAGAVTDNSLHGTGGKNSNESQSTIQGDVDLSILTQKGGPTYVDFKTKDEYKTTEPNDKSTSKAATPDNKISKLRSFFRKDFFIVLYLVFSN